MKYTFTLFFLFIILNSNAQEVAILKYSGGGDWYANPTAIPNLITFTNTNIKTNISKDVVSIEVGSTDIYNFPMVFLTGHGNVLFSEQDSKNLRNYLVSGGFLHVSDNFGLDPYIRRELKKVFPKLELQEIPKNHLIYHQTFKFPDGIPKIHEHNKKTAIGYGLFYEGRLIVFYDFETDLSDGWEDEIIHNNPIEVREKALKMGANLIEYVFKN